jgi:hypothetical protein
MPDPDEQLQRRLREELDQVQPLHSTARYQAVRARPLTLRVAPAAVAAVLLACLGLVAYSGSPNPTVWTQHVVTVIHPPVASPTAAPTPVQRPASPATHHESPEQHESPKPSQSPEHHESPEPSGEHSGDGSGDGSSSGSSDSGDAERS